MDTSFMSLSSFVVKLTISKVTLIEFQVKIFNLLFYSSVWKTVGNCQNSNAGSSMWRNCFNLWIHQCILDLSLSLCCLFDYAFCELCSSCHFWFQIEASVPTDSNWIQEEATLIPRSDVNKNLRCQKLLVDTLPQLKIRRVLVRTPCPVGRTLCHSPVNQSQCFCQYLWHMRTGMSSKWIDTSERISKIVSKYNARNG